MSESMFLMATKGKFRYPYKGSVVTEDLFDLNIRELDSIFKTLNSHIKQLKEESLLDVKTKQDEELDTKIEIIKYIVKFKQSEADARQQAKVVKEQEQEILGVISDKQAENLKNKTLEELQDMLKHLKQ